MVASRNPAKLITASTGLPTLAMARLTGAWRGDRGVRIHVLCRFSWACGDGMADVSGKQRKWRETRIGQFQMKAALRLPYKPSVQPLKESAFSKCVALSTFEFFYDGCRRHELYHALAPLILATTDFTDSIFRVTVRARE